MTILDHFRTFLTTFVMFFFNFFHLDFFLGYTSGSMIPRLVPEISQCGGFCDEESRRAEIGYFRNKMGKIMTLVKIMMKIVTIVRMVMKG